MGKSKKERRKKKKEKTEKKVPQNKSSKPISKSKKYLFWTLTILLPFIIFFLLEIGLRLFNYGLDTTLFVPTPYENSPYYGINLDIGKRYFNVGTFSPSPRKDLFLREKPENGYRIFVLGGSTTAGFPFGNNITFPRILHRRLVDTFPDKKIEVVNMAMTAVNSYTMLDFMDEILQQEPDLLLIYAGHNEFYGALGVSSMQSFGKFRWFVKTLLYLQRYKTFEMIKDMVFGISSLFMPAENKQDDPLKTQMAKIARDKEIPLNSPTYELGKEQFKNNLKDIFNMAKEAGIPVLISDLVSNIRDQEPFVSVESDTGLNANEQFRLARELEGKELYDQAKKAYYKAKDLDGLRFRAPEDFNVIIRDVAVEFNSPLVPMASYFEQISKNGLIGKNLMFEHLHPNKNGYFLMASAFFNELFKNKLIDENWPKENIKPVIYYLKTWGSTELDSIYAHMTIEHLKGGWPFKSENHPNTFLQNFKPNNKEESVVLSILLTQKKTLETARMELADYYKQKGDYLKAVQEHRALIYTVPFLDVFYEPLIELLIDRKQYPYALSILKDGLKYNESFFMYKWVGQLNLVTGQTEQGIPYIEEALKKSSDDGQLIYNLIRAYYTLKQFDKGDNLLAKLNSFPEFSDRLSELIDFKKSMQ